MASSFPSDDEDSDINKFLRAASKVISKSQADKNGRFVVYSYISINKLTDSIILYLQTIILLIHNLFLGVTKSSG